MKKLKIQSLIWMNAAKEAGSCMQYGLLDACRQGLWWRSALWCVLVTIGWLWLYVKQAGIFLELSGVVALVSFFGLFGTTLAGFGGTGGSVVAMGNIPGALASNLASGLASLGPFIQAVLAALAIAIAFYVLLFLLGVLVTIQLPIRWLFLQRAQTVVAKHYPDWVQPAASLITPPPRSSIKTTLVALLKLCIPIYAFFYVLKLMFACPIRLLYQPAAQSSLTDIQCDELYQQQSKVVLMLGLFHFVLMAIPIINLLVPALLCTSVCHLQRRGWINPQPTEIA
ncbi:hypothetical protein [Chitinivorax sp. B]|uniref:hypothetical protein n=1 Tax=Chitinivorax sp. B TaxID=2502235 RepID=UPI0010F6104D|nr:hypothetical protein [Chitinivorax sp. B]